MKTIQKRLLRGTFFLLGCCALMIGGVESARAHPVKIETSCNVGDVTQQCESACVPFGGLTSKSPRYVCGRDRKSGQYYATCYCNK